jgi:hypothetical protein
MLLVFQKNSSLSKQQDEYAYLKFIEDFCKVSFNSKQNFPLLLVLKNLMHKNFISQRFYDIVLKALQGFVDKVKEKMTLTEKESEFLKLAVD